MIRSVKIIIYGGYCDIVHDDVFSLTGDGEYLEYEKNGVWYIESNPSGKGGNTIISVPRNFEFSSFILKASGCAAKVSAIQRSSRPTTGSRRAMPVSASASFRAEKPSQRFRNSTYQQSDKTITSTPSHDKGCRKSGRAF